MLSNGDTSVFEPSTDGLQLIRDAIAASNPILYHPDASSSITNGNEDANTFASCSTDDGVRWTIGDVAGGLEVVCEFNMGTNRVASSILINGYYNRSGGGGFVTEIYAYNYLTAAWSKISVGSVDGEMRDRANDKDYEYPLSSAFTDRIGTPGEVKIRFLCTRGADGGDVLYLDYLALDGVTESALTADIIADAVAAHDVSPHVDHNSLGFRVGLSMIEEYAVSTADTAISFTCASLPAIANYYRFNAIRVHDVTNDRYADSWIASMDNAGVVILGRALPFTPDTSSELYVRAGLVSPSEIRTEMETGGGSIALILDDTGTTGVVIANDAGVTEVARVGADSDTLETLSDQLDALVPGAAVNLVITDTDIVIS